MSRTSRDKKINILIHKLTQLRVQREEITQQENLIQTELLSLSSNNPIDNKTVLNQSKQPTSVQSSRIDREGRNIDIGDTVRFLTPTKFKGNTGTVLSFSPHRVTVINCENRKISKDSTNLSVVTKASSTSTHNDNESHSIQR